MRRYALYFCVQVLGEVRVSHLTVGAQVVTGLRAGMGILPDQWRAIAYLLINLVSGTSIVFANKLVLSILSFHFVRPTAVL